MKRSFDVLVAGMALVVFSPLLAVVAAMVRIKLGRPILFRQLRPGLGGKPFTLFKFRTMLGTDAVAGGPPNDHQRLTDFGRMLRSWSLDELPELWNVLIGDMSLVGPRPLLMEYLPLYNAEQARRHEVRPGLTGWAQVNGRNALSWDDKFALDIWYVDHQSFWLDLKIIALTLLSVVRRHGIDDSGGIGQERFKGNSR